LETAYRQNKTKKNIRKVAHTQAARLNRDSNLNTVQV